MQSGGPTAVINASLVGAVEAARAAGAFGAVLGARHGVEGVAGAAFVDLGALGVERLERLRRTPSAALGTSRHRPSDAEVERILDVCAARRVEVVVPIGGNDTAETALRVVQAAARRGQPLRVVAVPKTIDNDLPETDHCPGYGSIARFVALAVRDAAFDTRAMTNLYPIKIVEVMGRNAGWLVAAGGLLFDDLPRPILCLPERPWRDLPALAERVRRRIDADGYAVLVVPETMKWADSTSVGGETPDWADAFGHRYFPSPGSALARLLTSTLDARARFDKPGTIARMAMHAVSEVDLAEAAACGAEAVRRALAGETGTMVTIAREDVAPYRAGYGSVPLERVANIERRLPEAFIADTGDDTTPAFADYARPLLGEPIPPYEVLE